MSNTVRKAACKFFKQLKGDVTFDNVETHLRKLGYRIVFFNTTSGDEEIIRYCLTEKTKQAKAFTYSSGAKIVFINNRLSAEDKFYLLLHESAHIILDHLKPGKMSTYNKILLDIDADAFVHSLLNPQPTHHKALVAGVATTSIVAGMFFFNPVADMDTVPAINIPAQPANIVYITSSGDRFHTHGCGTITGRATAQITRAEALKIHTPCSMCNP